ncbi:MAG: ATP-binding cassette domain-containing protein, partial [Gordonia sp. (in: high G+C Gram-positive bacteria)]
MAVVEASNLVREYQMGTETVRALDGASLTLDGGQFVSVVGPSGAGKSTLLHIIGALDVPTSGTIRVDGT